ncbi:MAG: MBL fold metallo-hydrolase [Solobacterium sp.]|nr:MBL fold metallo-hydrolase [Solobacterium sp.]
MTKQGWYKSGEDLITQMKTLQLPENQLAVWYLGQAGIVLKYGDKLYCIDPYLRESKARSFEPPFDASEAVFFDYIFCTHNHTDHLDEVALKAINEAGADTKYIVPAPHVHVLQDLGIAAEQIIAAKAGEKFTLGDISVEPVPAAHEEFSYDAEGNHEHLGFIIRTPAGTVYHSGDTIEWETMTEDLSGKGIDIMCLPINGSDWKRKKHNIIGNLDAREAADIADTCGADLLIPLHFDLFRHNGENPAHLTDYMYHDHPGHKYHIMVPGELFIYLK